MRRSLSSKKARPAMRAAPATIPIAIPALAPPLRPEEEDIALGDGIAGDIVSGPAESGWVDEEVEDKVVALDASVEADEAVEDVEVIDLVI